MEQLIVRPHMNRFFSNTSGPALLALLLIGCADQSPPDAPSTDARVDAVFKEFEAPGSPGASVAVVRDGAVIHAAGYGLSDLGAGSPLTPATPVRLASVSKAFMSAAIMILEA
ncbi:MAG: CubicO group peptidase (beta-lactamase class C family), partial [Thalassolituus oleivorans]